MAYSQVEGKAALVFHCQDRLELFCPDRGAVISQQKGGEVNWVFEERLCKAVWLRNIF